MNRKPSPFKVPPVEITPEIIVEHMEKARRMRDEAIVALLKKGTLELAHRIGKLARGLSNIYRRMSAYGSRSPAESCLPRGPVATDAEAVLWPPHPMGADRERRSAISPDRADGRRPRWHLAPRRDNQNLISEIGGHHA
jgi:hypothetical protein